jgi:hypothetical protein
VSDDAAAASMDAIIASIRDGMKDAGELPSAEPEAREPAPVATAAAAPAAETTLEALVRSALEPVLKAWLDANLPEIVDRAARDEIARLIKP